MPGSRAAAATTEETAPTTEEGPFLVIVDDTSDNHYHVGPFGDREGAQVFENTLKGNAGMSVSTEIVLQWDGEDVLKLFPAPTPLDLSEGAAPAEDEEK